MSKRLAFALLLLLANGCSPVYVMRAAYEHAKILSRREDISELLENPQIEDSEKRKLKLVLEAREYAKEIGLEPKQSFTQFAKVDGDVLSWVLVASKSDSFDLYSWWFPIVGSVPYKGFFELEDAQKAAEPLHAKGYETSIREASAFSTLGWFNDPLLSTTLKHDEVTLVNTVLHESVHTTYWLPGHVDFNESLANFIGTMASCDFFAAKKAACEKSDAGCVKENSAYLKRCEEKKVQEYEFAAIISRLYAELNTLYKSEKSTEEKLFERAVIFNSLVEPFRRKFPDIKSLRRINNAEILGLHLYLGGLREIYRFYKSQHNSYSIMLKTLEANSKSLKMSKDPLRTILELK